MMNKRSTLCLVLLSLLFLSCLCLPATSLAAEYLITDTELSQLESNLNRLEIINKNSQKELSAVKSELKMSKDELTEAKKQLILLQSELDGLRTTSQKEESLLAKANESLKTYAQEEKSKRAAIERQRNLAYVLSAGLLYAWVRK